jgi:ABC-type molybdenum transport system ATPase subunit/photorepair protein PhrA
MMLGEADRCQFRIDETEKAKVLAKKLQEDIALSRSNQKILTDTQDYLKAIKKKLVNYNAKKKERSMSAIYSAIYSAKSIIPDTTPVELKIEREDAMLINDRGDDVNLVEGSAFRATLSFFVRGVILRNTDYMQTMILDEPLTTLSAESSAGLSAYLPILAKEMQIILIEQKNEIFSNADSIVYNFQKAEGRTRVRKGV